MVCGKVCFMMSFFVPFPSVFFLCMNTPSKGLSVSCIVDKKKTEHKNSLCGDEKKTYSRIKF